MVAEEIGQYIEETCQCLNYHAL